jgi:hypothetical protein
VALIFYKFPKNYKNILFTVLNGRFFLIKEQAKQESHYLLMVEKSSKIRA